MQMDLPRDTPEVPAQQLIGVGDLARLLGLHPLTLSDEWLGRHGFPRAMKMGRVRRWPIRQVYEALRTMQETNK